jgi:hypothetical protein
VENSIASKIIQWNSSREPLWLVLAGVASIGFYLLFAGRYPLGPSLSDPRASWTSMVGASWLSATIHLAIYLGLILLYLFLLSLLFSSHKENTTFPYQPIYMILVVWSVSSVVLMFAAPAGESHDVFDYIFRGRMMTEYQSNPLANVPAEFDLSTPYTRYLAWRKNVDTYGPLWEMASASVSGSVRQLAHWLGWWDDGQPTCPRSPESCRLLILYISGYRILAISLTGISGWLIASIVRRVKASLVPLALATWLLNPLTLIATAVGAHNDAVMLALVVFSWWLLQRQYPLLAVIALTLAAHVKLTALIWLPACAIWIGWRWGWKRALQIGLVSTAVGLVLSWLLYAPFDGWQTLPRMLKERSAYLANSPWRILKHMLIDQWDWSTKRAHQLTIGLSSLLFVLGALLTPLRQFGFRPTYWSRASIHDEEANSKLWHALSAISLLYLLVGSFWFQHWYVLWALAPAALLPGREFTRSILPWLTFGALFSNVAMDLLLNTVIQTSPAVVKYTLVVIMIWGPMLFATIVLALTRRTSKKTSLDKALSY